MAAGDRRSAPVPTPSLAIVDYAHHRTPAERTEYLAATFARFLSGRVLDVGCDQRVLKRLRPDLDYVGVDIAGEPDVRLNLELIDRLPFDDRSFDTVVCADVLEHLDQLHRVFAEVVRVARRYLIVSFPNCWADARRPVERGKGGIGYYGLASTPFPDRHKWFFNLTDARDFALGVAGPHGLTIADMRVREKPRPTIIRWARRLRFPRRERYLNRYAHTLWVVFERLPAP